MHYDVAIIGGGPSGSTAGCLLRKYNPDLKVLILEKEKFPRDHIGESQLPLISNILDEMGVWDKVEAANFPIKIGATYRWGNSDKLWDFEFFNAKKFVDAPRPAKFEGQRRFTAFQVDRAIYDKILLDHAAEMGCEVREQTQARKIHRDPDDPDLITGIEVEGPDGAKSTITAKHYIDASGGVGVLRRAMGVQVDCPTTLQNVAIWDYWNNAEWAVEIGVGATRVQVLSIEYGWLWFIPLGPTRTSLGLVTSARYYKERGASPEELYLEAISKCPRIAELTANATREGPVQSTKDWSFLAERIVGKNWFLAGESAGFADPILAGGMTLAHSGAREVAYTILELERGELDPKWLRERYEETQKVRIGQHIKFADFWYAGNGQFPDLQEYTTNLAKEVGLKLTPAEAFRWLSTGGFATDNPGVAVVGTFDVGSAKQVIELFTGRKVGWAINNYNVFKLNLRGATEDTIPFLRDGRIRQCRRFRRGDSSLSVVGLFEFMFETLQFESEVKPIMNGCLLRMNVNPASPNAKFITQQFAHVLEAMLAEHWVVGKYDKKKPKMIVETLWEDGLIRPNADERPARAGA